jgi:hypothetical protein
MRFEMAHLRGHGPALHKTVSYHCIKCAVLSRWFKLGEFIRTSTHKLSQNQNANISLAVSGERARFREPFPSSGISIGDLSATGYPVASIFEGK